MLVGISVSLSVFLLHFSRWSHCCLLPSRLMISIRLVILVITECTWEIEEAILGQKQLGRDVGDSEINMISVWQLWCKAIRIMTALVLGVRFGQNRWEERTGLWYQICTWWWSVFPPEVTNNDPEANLLLGIRWSHARVVFCNPADRCSVRSLSAKCIFPYLQLWVRAWGAGGPYPCPQGR